MAQLITANDGLSPYYTGLTLTRDLAQTIDDSTTTNLIWTVETQCQPSTQHSIITNPDTITVVYTGYYGYSVMASFVANSTGVRKLDLLVNGSIIHEYPINNTTTLVPTLFVNGVAYLTAGQTLTATVYQTSGGPLDIHGDLSCQFCLYKLGE